MNPVPNQNSIPIPNALTITINTSVPGYQIIKYKPNMTLPDIDKELTTIWFDPLIPLNQSVINKVPENIKVVEFFNKGLFRSLINAHGNQKPITLEQAKKNKIIDNNIQLTLNALFPSNGILYIKGEPYAIADIQWKKGDWKIDRKIKNVPEIDASQISDPTTYNIIVKKDIQTGNEQLAKLPVALIYGDNFDPTTEEPSSIDTSNIKKTPTGRQTIENGEPTTSVTGRQTIENGQPTSVVTGRQTIENGQPTSVVTGRQTIENGEPTPAVTGRQTIENGEPTPAVTGRQTIENGQPNPAIVPGPSSEAEAEPEVGEAEEIPNILMSENHKPNLKSSNSTNFLRLYFGNPKFYLMISMIFKYMTLNEKKFIQTLFKKTTDIDVKGSANYISAAAYKFTLTGLKTVYSGGIPLQKQFTDGLRVISNAGGGDCFFIAVADAINYYNYSNNNNIDEKIIHNNYGNGDMIFTANFLRQIVSTEIVKSYRLNPAYKNEILAEAQVNSDNLNDIHETAIRDTHESMGPNLSEDYYNATKRDIYLGNPNVFVIRENNPADPNRPFKAIKTAEELKTYIESLDYWADTKTIDILNKILKLKIIVITNINDKLTIPYPGIKSTDSNNTWTKYLFLYNHENHYELITFDYFLKGPIKFGKEKKTIFNRENIIRGDIIRDDIIIPPFYIIFLLFSTFYIKLVQAEKDTIILFEYFLYSIQDSFNKILIAPSDKDIVNFTTYFQTYFQQIRNEIRGGAINNTTGSPSFLKKEDNQDDIQISFHITIDMELQKGKTLSKEQISNIKCIKGWNNVRKSFAEFTGQKYVLPPVYENLSDKYNKKEDNSKKIDPNKKENNNNNTKKNITGGEKEKKKRRTRKKLNH